MYWPRKTLSSHVLKKVLRMPPDTVRVPHSQVINQDFTEVHSPTTSLNLQWEGIFSLFSEKIPSVFFNLLVTSQWIRTRSPRKEVKRWENANLLSKHTEWRLWLILLCTAYTLMDLKMSRDIKFFKTNRSMSLPEIVTSLCRCFSYWIIENLLLNVLWSSISVKSGLYFQLFKYVFCKFMVWSLYALHVWQL